jgi:hypothetical protein
MNDDMLELFKSIWNVNTEQPLLPRLTRLMWMAPWEINDAMYFMHASIRTFHICLPDFPDIYYCLALVVIPSKMPYLQCLQTFMVHDDTADLWEPELVSLQSQLPRLGCLHPHSLYDQRAE